MNDNLPWSAPPQSGAPAQPGAHGLAIASLACALLALAVAAGGMVFGASASVFPPAHRSPSANLELISGVVIGMGLGAAPSLVLSIPAVITGHIARARLRRSGSAGGRRMALTGLVLGYLDIAIPFLVIALSFALFIISTFLH